MKAAKITIVLIAVFVILKWLCVQDKFPLPTTLPWLGGHEPCFYDFGALALIILAILGLRRLSRNRDDDE